MLFKKLAQKMETRIEPVLTSEETRLLSPLWTELFFPIALR
jgi:hypothetical protein